MRLLPLLPILFYLSVAAVEQAPRRASETHAKLAARLRGLRLHTASRQAGGGRGNGLTLDRCDTDADCKKPRICEVSTCFLPEELDRSNCKTCADCPEFPHEACSVDPDVGKTCTSAKAVATLKLPLTAGCEGVAKHTPEVARPSSPATTAATTTTMTTTITTTSKQSDSPTPSPTMTPTPTSSSSPSPSPSASASASASASPLPPGANSADAQEVNPGDDGVCIAVHHLSHLPARHLVFAARHRRARVLCDAAGSCATPGHMVALRGRPMSMRAYCAAAAPGGCTQVLRALVNSPRFRPGVRVPSRTDGLEFTALAARFETRLEERVLAAVIRAARL